MIKIDSGAFGGIQGMMTDVRLLNMGRYPAGNPESRKFTPCNIFVCKECGIPTCMNFNAWLHQRQIPDSDKITMIIQSAGANGIPENELRSGIELPKKLVDELLAALVDARMVRVVEKDGVRWYFGW